ncbi:MAG TPA: fibronectin type III domain-containing protein, partial [Flavisolibacter sp.]|nr:fibronectin type III domain-containing protein [Flavisolibacter sp.]
SGTFALAGLRIFGNGGGKAPAVVQKFNAVRSPDDRAVVQLSWNKLPEAVGYNIRYGAAKDKMYHTYQVLGADSLTIRSLNATQKYYFTIDAFNENGTSKGKDIIELN